MIDPSCLRGTVATTPVNPADLLAHAEAMVYAAVSDGSWEIAQAAVNATGSGPSPLDPDEARSSGEELRLLVAALRGLTEPPSPPSSGPCRGGYSLTGSPHSPDGVVPTFAAALAGSTSLDSFEDIWAIDLDVVHHLQDRQQAARRWLDSPGRRLLLDLDTLPALRGAPPTSWARGATSLSPTRVLRAAGLIDHPPVEDSRSLAGWFAHKPEAWRELHAAVPGELLRHWQPSPPDIPRGLELLERGSPVTLRAGALAWLLDRAASEPFYSVEDIRRDLRDDLPVRLAIALGRGAARPSVHAALEVALLQHAAAIEASWDEPVSVAVVWGLGRWLYSTLIRSPYFGGDEETLLARVRALLPRELPRSEDPLHPSQLKSPEQDGIDLDPLFVVAGAIRHYRRVDGSVLLPTPLPLVNALQRVARQPVGPLLTQPGPDGLGWYQSCLHVDPALAARWLLTQELKAAWLQDAGEAIQLECISLLEQQPAQTQWLAFAIQREGRGLSPQVQNTGLRAWRELTKSEARLAAHAAVAMAAGLAPLLTDLDIDRVLVLNQTADFEWRPFLLAALAQELEPAPHQWARVMEALVDVAADDTGDDRTRLNAALHLIRRVASGPTPQKQDVEAGLSRLVASLPFRDHSGLRRELRRLGLPARLIQGRSA